MRDFSKKLIELLYQGLEKKFLILNALLAFLLFGLFPFLIFFRGADMLIQRHIIRENSLQRREIEKQLDQMALYANNDIFAHRLLFRLCHKNSTQKRSLNEIRPLIKRLKKSFPQTFTFIVADSSGNLMEELSDENKFSYLYRQAFSFLFEFEKTAATLPKDDIDSRLQRLRPLLGDLLRPQDIHKPFLPEDHGRSILVSGAKQKFHLWHGSGTDFKLIVFISRDFIRGTAGLEWFVDRANNSGKGHIFGYSTYPPDESQLKKFVAEHNIPAIEQAMAENEAIKIPAAEGLHPEKIVCRFLNQHYRGFCLRKDSMSLAAGQLSYSLVATILKFFLLALFVFYVRQKINPVSLTIKLKISAFFAYSILLPIMIIASISGEFLAQQTEELTENLGRQAFRFSRNLDTRFDFALQQTAEKLNRFVSEDYQKNPLFGQNREWCRNFNETIKNLAAHEEIMVIDADAKDHILGYSPRLTANTTLIKRFSADALRLTLNKGLDKVTENVENPYFVALLAHSGQGKIGYTGVGELDLYSYTQLLTNSMRELEKSFAVYILWKKSSFQERFISENAQKGFDMENAIPAFYNIENRSIILTGFESTGDNELINFFRQSEGHQINFNKALKINGKDYLAVAVSGQKLDKTLTALLYPAEILEKQIGETIKAAAYAAALMILFASAGAWLLSGWIFKPLNTLKTGIRAIADHNFNHKLEVVCQNEMGKLIKAFNSSIETLQDLEVARVVQESFLSQNLLKKNRLEIAAKSHVMTRLGGDYHDIVEDSSTDKVLVFIGDATGHGIPAAISMAMAKAVMLHENLEGIDQTRLMGKLHTLFSRLRSQGVKDFMTATSVMLDSITGQVNFINAGHCYPILLKNGASEGKLLSEVKGLPPGFSRSLKLMPVTMQLEPGDILVLYTDGLVESCNSAHELLGFDRLLKIVAETRTDDLAEQLEKILNVVKQWELEPNDDQTAILVRYT